MRAASPTAGGREVAGVRPPFPPAVVAMAFHDVPALRPCAMRSSVTPPRECPAGRLGKQHGDSTLVLGPESRPSARRSGYDSSRFALADMQIHVADALYACPVPRPTAPPEQLADPFSRVSCFSSSIDSIRRTRCSACAFSSPAASSSRRSSLEPVAICRRTRQGLDAAARPLLPGPRPIMSLGDASKDVQFVSGRGGRRRRSRRRHQQNCC